MPNPNIKEEPPAASVYIRSLVRHLSSSRPREIPNPNSSHPPSIAGAHSPPKSPSDELPPQNQKKQVRRRLNSTRPYQGRLLNMAEARREIVTALKFHRATIKQRPPATISPLPVSNNPINFTFPSRPLGLNLNFQGFANVETPLFTNRPPTSPSSSSAAAAPAATKSDLTLHPAMGEEEMAEIISMIEMHEMEWNDTLNSVSMAWWSELLMAMEVENREGGYCHGDCILLENQMEDDQLQPW